MLGAVGGVRREAEKGAVAWREEAREVRAPAAKRPRVGRPGEAEMLLRWQPGLPLPQPQLLLLLGSLAPFSLRAPVALAEAEDTVALDFSTERPVHLVSPAFLSFTIDANLATDPRFLTFLG